MPTRSERLQRARERDLRKGIQGFSILPPQSWDRVPGQVPGWSTTLADRGLQLRPEIKRELERQPQPWSEQRFFARPVLNARAIVDGLGLQQVQAELLEQFLDTEIRSASNMMELRQRIMPKLMEDAVDPLVRRILLERSAALWVSLQDGVKFLGKSSAVTRPDGDEIAEETATPSRKTDKAARPGKRTQRTNGNAREPIGGSYHRRVDSPDGKRTYYYDQGMYEADHGSHIEGKTARSSYLDGAVFRTVSGAGKKGCEINGFAPLVKRFGPQAVHGAVRAAVDGGRVSYGKGRWSAFTGQPGASERGRAKK